MFLLSTRWPQIRAGAVHLYTATGAIFAFLVVVAAIQHATTQALWLLLAANIVDSTDGVLARRFRVKEVLPWFDGRKLDDIVDYLAYVFAPIVLLWTDGFLPLGTSGLVVASLPLLASGYQFCRVDAKTDDNFFLGFPSYWNVIAFYALVLHWTPLVTGSVLTLCAALVFVPIRYIYPSRTRVLRPLTLLLNGLWILCYVAILLITPAKAYLLSLLSLGYPAYYIALSLALTRQSRREHIAAGRN